MTIQTSWEMMQQYRVALDLAKWRKQVRAEHMEQIRNATEYMRSLRYWLTVASSHRTLRARKAALTEHLARINSLQPRQAVTFCCEIKLVGDSCQSNLMAAICWAEAALTAPTFGSWDICSSNAETRSADALVQLDVVRSTFKSLWKQAKADMTTARSVIDTCAKDILHPVALSKQAKVDTIRLHALKFTSVPLTVAQCTKANLYKLARYHHAKNTTKPNIPFKVWSIAVAAYANTGFPV